MLNLIESSNEHSVDFDRYLLISGMDYPIKGLDQLMSYLKNETKEIVRIDRRLYGKYEAKITNLNIHDIGWLNYKNYSGLYSRLLSKLLKRVGKIKIREMPKNFKFVHGSTWMCLSNRAVECILNYNEKNKGIYNLLKWSFSSDEVYFHSILYNAGFQFTQLLLDADEKEVCKVHGIHYIDWTYKFGTLPKQIDFTDINEIANCENVFFVRKVNPNNAELISELDAIAGENTMNK